MTDDRLNKLKTMPVPPPSPKAKMAAIDAAMAAFDAAGEAADLGTGAETAAVAKGSAEAPRQKTSLIAKAWSWFMTDRIVTPVAASLLILPVAGYVVYQFARDYRQEQAVPGLAQTFSGGQGGAPASARPESKLEAKLESKSDFFPLSSIFLYVFLLSLG